MSFVYADYNASAPLRPEAAEAMNAALRVTGNPSSIHSAGRATRRILEDARESVASAVGARVENVVFTSGATEALHLALRGARAASVIVSATEHDACFAEAIALGAKVAPVTRGGEVDLAALQAILRDAAKPALVAVMLANNETGIVQPIARIASLVREAGGLLLVDAAQALGRMAVSIGDLDASYLVVSSHKIGGPQGIGALVLAPGAPFAAMHAGGGQERGRRPGTENIAAAAGFGAAAAVAARDVEVAAVRLAMRRDVFEQDLPRDAIVFGRDSVRLPNTSLFALPGVRAETAVIALDLAGVAVSSGAACSSGKVRESRVLKAMGVDEALAKSALRVSFGWNSTTEDAERAAAAVAKLVRAEAA